MKEKVYIIFYVIGFFPGLLLAKSLGIPSLIAGIIVGAITGVLSSLLGNYLYNKGYIINLYSIVAFIVSAFLFYFFLFFVVAALLGESNPDAVAVVPIPIALFAAMLYMKREWKKYHDSLSNDDEINQ
ncbi:hypothetical protein BBD42_12925 [Paenibacillus sp. BIHB 4019]|uniref:Uncharacterized protein n=1 Tax=Paenibacillus sp. BIHB 4019 TaxID=1870819 RepID=A0A1B2DHU3_9BACL|nr:hypothetical protein [Paenibacillus sp. BIHB 4019]ANY67273.1 hypothetical protein BBD42_12925 [Paenibacillus sp. BIHB 4019]